MTGQRFRHQEATTGVLPAPPAALHHTAEAVLPRQEAATAAALQAMIGALRPAMKEVRHLQEVPAILQAEAQAVTAEEAIAEDRAEVPAVMAVEEHQEAEEVQVQEDNRLNKGKS